MIIYSFFDPHTGVISGMRFTGPEQHLAANTPPGLASVPGALDPDNQRVELRPDDFGNAVVAVVVDWQPPQPPETEWLTWAWDAERRRYVSTPSTAALARDARAERDRRLDATAPITLRAYRLGQPVPADWAAYMQALADVPSQPGFPTAIDWPQLPSP
ncbi:phage tail assembly chaperone [Roseateles cavernae]|uniref:phage tail assembly chaperone n=1 Tax=Roseateles cavernae TaxID=3153578 RepID=UPI0032E44A99